MTDAFSIYAIYVYWCVCRWLDWYRMGNRWSKCNSTVIYCIYPIKVQHQCIVPHILFMVAPGSGWMHSQCAGWQKVLWTGIFAIRSKHGISYRSRYKLYLLELIHPRVKNDVGIVNMRKINVWLIRDKDQWEIIKVIC